MESTDIEIINQCINGDPEAFTMIVTRYKKLIYSVVINMVQDIHEVDDAAQEAFLKIYKSLDQFNPEYKFSTWAVKITTNLCIDRMKRKQPKFVHLDEVKELQSNSDSPESLLIKKEKRRSINNALQALPEKYKIPLILFHQSGLSYEEMADVMNEPMTIVKNRLHRARLMLRERLQVDRKE
ncbi:sigma-70 family RNA polymerase sigma factor [Candidatus Desantisbacteria bacterium]|nr:sigma-70 family RNA polymerase sigma factor [Candidatus Desantisbacteria bacterium]